MKPLSHTSGVSLVAEGLRISTLAIIDPDTVVAAQQADQDGQRLDDWLIGIIRAGVLATAAVSSSRELAQLNDAVRRTGEQLEAVVTRSSTELTSAIAAAVDPTRGPLAVATREQVNRLADGVARLVTGEDAVLPTSVRASVDGVTARALAEIQRSLAASVGEMRTAVAADRQLLNQAMHELIVRHGTAVTEQVTGLREQLTAEAMPRQPRASVAIGADYEHEVVQKFSQISQDAGDRCNPTGTVTGSLGTKVGDAVVELLNPSGGSPLGRLALEAKDHCSPWSQARLLAEAEAARGNREAQASLLVCARAAMLPGGRSLLVLTPTDIAISWSPGDSDEVVRAAYLLLKVAVARGPQSHSETADLGALRERADRALRHLAAFDQLQRLLGTTSKNVNALSTALTQLRVDLTIELDALTEGLRPPT